MLLYKKCSFHTEHLDLFYCLFKIYILLLQSK
nr:MAG TPA: hypothetical protein [Crassvirales sp.]